VRTVAALYIDPRGPYPSIPGVECWDAARDARLYEGPHPVVAHPPCGPWGRLKHLYRGSEHDCAPRAIEQVRAWGGVLEHPAGSQLFPAMGLPMPGEQDAFGQTFLVQQVDWGHVARKPTWLYVVRVDAVRVLAGIFARRGTGTPTHWVSGFRSTTRPRTYDRSGSAVPPGIKVCSAQQRRRTPRAFAEWLVDLARYAEPASRAA
jgi:hypothetical protein